MNRSLALRIGAPALALALVLGACGDDDDATDPTATPTQPANETPGESPTNTPDAETPTGEPETETPEPGDPTPPPPTDGTVDPLGFGQTEDWSVKPWPTDPATEVAVLKEVRLGVHPEEGGWERIVFEFEGDEVPGGVIGYVEEAAQCGSGETVELEGEAILGIRLEGAQAHDDDGNVTVNMLEFEGPGGAIIEGMQACDFEAHVDWFLGMDEVSRFKVTRLEGPARLVVDIKQ
jgi:hypothetical protein